MLREFKDSDGVAWRVWDVNPILHARSSKSLRRAGFTQVPTGWLCFEGDNERRRLAPIPEQWQTCDDAALERLCAKAEPVRPRPDDHPEGLGGPH